MQLSIITINLNNKLGLKKTIESLHSQTFKNFEYIVIDGESKDGSQEIVNEYTCINKYISEKDKGIYDAMNKGINLASGKYLLFLNSGDYLHHNSTLEQAIKQLEDFDIIYGDLIFENDTQKYQYSFPDNLTFDFLFNHSLPHPASFIKKELFDKFGLYNTDYKIISDWVFFLETIVNHRASTKHINQIISNFNIDGISSAPKYQTQIYIERTEILKNKFPLFYPDYIKLQKTKNDLERLKSSKAFKWLKKLGVKKFQ